MPLPWEKQKSIEDLQEENERADVELSITQKKALMARLKKEGLSVNRSFGGSLKAAYKWFLEH